MLWGVIIRSVPFLGSAVTSWIISSSTRIFFIRLESFFCLLFLLSFSSFIYPQYFIEFSSGWTFYSDISYPSLFYSLRSSESEPSMSPFSSPFSFFLLYFSSFPFLFYYYSSSLSNSSIWIYCCWRRLTSWVICFLKFGLRRCLLTGS